MTRIFVTDEMIKDGETFDEASYAHVTKDILDNIILSSEERIHLCEMLEKGAGWVREARENYNSATNDRLLYYQCAYGL